MGGPYSNSFGATSVDDDPLPNTPSSQTWLLKKIASLLQSVVANGTTGGGATNPSSYGITPPTGVGAATSFTYYAGTNNIETQTFLQGSTVNGVLTFTYLNGGVADNDLVTNIERTA
jgi:hypothetical protein